MILFPSSSFLNHEIARQDLLTKAEDDLRNARATSASGSEHVRYYNTTATRRHRNKRRQNSVSENLTHGGSLNNLSKEELYEATTHLQRPKKTVSARQKEGGNLSTFKCFNELIMERFCCCV